MTMQTNGSGSTALARPAEGRDVDASIIERVIAMGDLGKLQPAERVSYYMATCRSVGLNPLTKPFDYLSLNGKLVLYSNKNCTDQLRQLHSISVVGLTRETTDGVHVVTARVRDRQCREDEDIGAVPISGLKGEHLANALMKATTKAKRRATLSICGLSFIDESEIDSIPDARRVVVDAAGEIIEGKVEPTASQPALSPPAKAVDADAVYKSLEVKIDAARKAGSLADLKKVAAEISASSLAKDARQALFDVYDFALDELEGK